MERSIEQDEIDLRAYIDVITRRWRVIALVVILLMTGALIFSLNQKPVYEAKATFLIRSNSGGGGLGQLSGLAGMVGLNLPSNGDSADLTTLLQSNAVAIKLADNLHLRERIKGWNAPGLRDDQIASIVKGMIDKPKTQGNLVEIKVGYSDPALAAEITNGYLDALSFYWNKLNYTSASKKKEYIEGQLPRVEAELRTAENKLKQFTLLAPASSGPANLANASDQSGASGISGSSLQGIETARLAREVNIQTTVYGMLRTEYEQVKLEESKDLPAFLVIDKAETPLSKSKPKTKLNIIIGGVLGIFVGVFVVFFQDYWEKSGKRD
jgi:uncharacterized protein involved in exopolysaccharide biosynthesis